MFALLLLILLSVLLTIGVTRSVSAIPSARGSERASKPPPDYSKFSHSTPEKHKELTDRSCIACHRRNDNQLQPRFPLHRDCIGCHLVQFTASISASPDNPICTICHSQDGLNSSNPTTKRFPALISFDARFDHAQHMRGIESARPRDGCSACHAAAGRGVAQTIPTSLSAHRTCYECHSPGGRASSFSSCDSCHALAAYSPTTIAARAYRVSFSHADHGVRQRLTCESCHNVLGRGLPQRKQVSSILPAQHFANARAQSCMTCHNGQRSFGDADTRDCKRCHKRPGFRM